MQNIHNGICENSIFHLLKFLIGKIENVIKDKNFGFDIGVNQAKFGSNRLGKVIELRAFFNKNTAVHVLLISDYIIWLISHKTANKFYQIDA